MKGNALVEFILVLPILVAVFAGSFRLALMSWNELWADFRPRKMNTTVIDQLRNDPRPPDRRQPELSLLEITRFGNKNTRVRGVHLNVADN